MSCCKPLLLIPLVSVACHFIESLCSSFLLCFSFSFLFLLCSSFSLSSFFFTPLLATCHPFCSSLPSPGSRTTVQYMSSLCELPQALQPYYIQGYVLTTLHPIILSVGRTRSLPFSLLYRAILTRPRPRYQTHTHARAAFPGRNCPISRISLNC